MNADEKAGSDNGQVISEEDLGEARAVAERFFAAVRDDDPHGLWRLFSEDAQAYVLNLAVERGMDFDLGSAIRQGTASEEDTTSYLEGLAEGIRRDLKGVDFDNLIFEAEPHPSSPGHVRVTYLLQVQVAIGDVRPTIPAGSLDMVADEDGWRVQRLIPKPG